MSGTTVFLIFLCGFFAGCVSMAALGLAAAARDADEDQEILRDNERNRRMW